jgi:uncharacterized membrane protein
MSEIYRLALLVKIAQNQQNLIIISTMTTFLCFFSIYVTGITIFLTLNNLIFHTYQFSPCYSDTTQVEIILAGILSMQVNLSRCLSELSQLTSCITIFRMYCAYPDQTFDILLIRFDVKIPSKNLIRVWSVYWSNSDRIPKMNVV